jgi:hypothetical protein
VSKFRFIRNPPAIGSGQKRRVARARSARASFLGMVTRFLLPVAISSGSAGELAYTTLGNLPQNTHRQHERWPGTGRVDHALTFLASKDIKRFHFDFNFSQFLIGRPNLSGFDKNQQLNLAFSHVIRGRLQFTGEFYDDTRLNPTAPGFVSSLWALTYTVAPRLVIDSGFEAGLTSGGPHRHAFLGATYSIANLYPGWRRNRPRNAAESIRRIE